MVDLLLRCLALASLSRVEELWRFGISVGNIRLEFAGILEAHYDLLLGSENYFSISSTVSSLIRLHMVHLAVLTV